MRQVSGGSVALAHVWSHWETVCQGFFAMRRGISGGFRGDLADTFSKIRRYYTSKNTRDWTSSFRSFIAAMAQLTIDLGKESRR
jgi:hypothetical protein